MTAPRALLVLLLAGVMAGCGGPRGGAWMVSRLYCGLSSPAGPVTAAQFDAFLAEEVTPRFPAGLTVYHADGQWRGASGAVEREPSMVIEVVHPGTAEDGARIAAIIRLYKARFHQESVLLLEDRPRVRFE
jgi:hypothetical protein